MNIFRWTNEKIYVGVRSPRTRAMVDTLVPFRVWINLGTHLFLFVAAYFTAVKLVYGQVDYTSCIERLPYTLLPLLVIKVLVFSYHDMYQGLWRFVSFEDIINITRATAISMIFFFLLGLVLERIGLPERVYLADAILTIGFCGGVRILVRSFRERFVQPPTLDLKNIVLVGPVAAVVTLVKEMLANPRSEFNPLAIIDPVQSPHAALARVSDVPVYSYGAFLASHKPSRPIHMIGLCWPEATRAQMDHAVDQLQSLGVPFKKLPNVEDLLSGKVEINDFHDVEVQDLLERPGVSIDLDNIGAYLRDKVVLVSGGGGSIGSELCFQIAAYQPRQLVVVERSENSLYTLRSDLKERFPHLNLMACISTINNQPGLETLFTLAGVEVVFHAAAYKHVPLMEAVPIESAYNNIIGTWNLARSARNAGVKRFVMISTDKAVNPTNIMGVTKRVAEMVVQSMNDPAGTRFMTVRFGNVLGSAGSVIPIFQRQLQQGKPLTVTHPDIERYFMTIPEAVQLVLQAGCMGQGGEIFVLDMGQPVRIVKLAEKLITLSGKRPYVDVGIQFTGLRPGEKMYEELFNTGECLLPTSHPRIRTAACEKVETSAIEARIAEIARLIQCQDEAGIVRMLQALVPGYCPSPDIGTKVCNGPQLWRDEAPPGDRGAGLRAVEGAGG